MTDAVKREKEFQHLLKRDRARLRRRIAADEERIRELETAVAAGGGSVPEGHVMLTGEDAKAWTEARTAFEAAGLTPEAGIAALAEREQLQARITEADAADLARLAAEHQGWSPKVLTELLKLGREVHLEMVEMDLVGGLKPIPHVRTANDAEPVPLDVYAKREWEHYLPALKFSKDAPSGDEPPRRPAAGSYPSQQSRGKPGPSGRTPEQRAAEKHSQVDYAM